MNTATLVESTFRPKQQLTMPAHIAREMGLRPYDQVIWAYSNGQATIIQKPKRDEKDDLMSYAGIFKGAWGETTQAIDSTISNLRNEWTR